MADRALYLAKIVLYETNMAMSRVEKAASDEYLRKADDAAAEGNEPREAAMLAKAKACMVSSKEYAELAAQNMADAKAALED